MPLDQSLKRFEFEVVTISSASVVEENAARARSRLDEALAEVGALITNGAAAGLELTRLRMVGRATLLSIDGRDPTAEIEAALIAYHSGERAPRADDVTDARSEPMPGEVPHAAPITTEKGER